MRNKPPPGSKLVGDWRGKRVRLVNDIRNGAAKFPAGTMGTVEGVNPGLRLVGDPCTHCGVRLYITRVPTSDVELVSADTSIRDSASRSSPPSGDVDSGGPA